MKRIVFMVTVALVTVAMMALAGPALATVTLCRTPSAPTIRHRRWPRARHHPAYPTPQRVISYAQFLRFREEIL